MIEFKSVYKRFGKVEALKNVSFTIPEKTVTAFLGPNGAGKTTSMRLIMGFIKPTKGHVFVWGVEPWKDESIRGRMGYLPERPLYPMDLTVESFLGHLAKLRGVSKSDLNRIARLVGLENTFGKKIGSLSRGYIQRVGIAQSLLGDPDLLILDEPTANLDPATRREIIDLLKVLHKELGISMIVSSHIIPELQEISNYVVFIDMGTILDYGYLSDLWQKYGIETTFIIETIDVGAVAKTIADKPFVHMLKRLNENILEVSIDAKYFKSFENLLSEMDHLIRNYSFKTVSLGELYEKVVRKERQESI